MPDVSNYLRARTLVVPRSPCTLADIRARIGVCLKASRNNSGSIYFGGSDVNVTGSGYELLPGDMVFLQVDNAKVISMISVLDNDKVSYYVV